MILAIKTDNPTVEIYIYSPEGKQLLKHIWQADRRLAKELLGVLIEQLGRVDADFSGLTGLVVYQGPGSFTGLRIGITVANAIAYGQNIPIVGTQGNDWQQTGLERLQNGQNDRIVLPHYGAEANISTPKK